MIVEEMQPWIPLVNKMGSGGSTDIPFEGFVTASTTTEAQTRTIVGSIFVATGMMIFSSIFALLFYWSYQKEKTLFIAILNGVIFIFTLKMLILVAVMRSKLNPTVFKIYMGSTVFIAFMTLFMIIYFTIKAIQRIRSSTSSSSSYVSPNIQNYISSSNPSSLS